MGRTICTDAICKIRASAQLTAFKIFGSFSGIKYRRQESSPKRISCSCGIDRRTPDAVAADYAGFNAPCNSSVTAKRHCCGTHSAVQQMFNGTYRLVFACNKLNFLI